MGHSKKGLERVLVEVQDVLMLTYGLSPTCMGSEVHSLGSDELEEKQVCRC